MTSDAPGLILLDPLDEAQILEGHRQMLATFRSFLADLDAGCEQPPDVDGLRGLLAFLRQNVLAFGRWEEACFAPATPTAEDTGFEHAFLAGEIDAFAAIVERLAGEPGCRRACPTDSAALRRRLHRIEAVLELHVSKAEDRAAVFATPEPRADAEPRPVAAMEVRPQPAVTAGPRELDRQEADAVLTGAAWGVLATIDDGQPYAVPVAFGYDGSSIFLACAPGRKAANLVRHPQVCLTVAEVVDGQTWRSIVVEGLAEAVDDLVVRATALRRIHAQRAASSRPSARDALRAARAQVFRIVPHRVGGRARG